MISYRIISQGEPKLFPYLGLISIREELKMADEAGVGWFAAIFARAKNHVFTAAAVFLVLEIAGNVGSERVINMLDFNPQEHQEEPSTVGDTGQEGSVILCESESKVMRCNLGRMSDLDSMCMSPTMRTIHHGDICESRGSAPIILALARPGPGAWLG